jgi:hypothetical protein
MKFLVSKKVSTGFGLVLILLVANILILYQTAIETVPQNTQALKRLAVDNSPQQQRLDLPMTEKLANIQSLSQNPANPDGHNRRAPDPLVL